MLVKDSSANQSQLVLSCTTIVSFTVSVQLQPELLISTKDEPLQNIKDENIIDERRITICRNSVSCRAYNSNLNRPTYQLELKHLPEMSRPTLYS